MESSMERVSVISRSTVRGQLEDDQKYLLICVGVPPWSNGAVILPGKIVHKSPKMKNKGYCMELEVETVMKEGESLEAFWERCREESKLALAFRDDARVRFVTP